MEMKRVLSALLCAVMLLTSVPVLAATDEATPGEATRCDHANGETTLKEQNVTYAQDATTHTKSYDLVVVHTCPDCEAGNYEDAAVPTTDPAEAHSFVNGVCDVCGYACQHSYADGACTVCGQACAHSFADGACTICGQACAHSFANGACTVCGQACQHSFVENICSICGYEKTPEVTTPPCDHSACLPISLQENRHVTSFDEQYHYVEYDLYNQEFCELCKEYIGEKVLVQKGVRHRESHSLDANGVCSGCDYVNSCAHENVEEYTRWDWTTQNVISMDEQGHRVTMDILKVRSCVDCGKRLSEEVAEKGAELVGQHEFLEGICTICEYRANQECAHPDFVENVYYNWVGVISKDQNGHVLKGDKITEKICKSCGARERSVEPDQVISEAHAFYLGRCQGCGYQNTCAHGETKTKDAYSRIYNITSTKTTHTFSGCRSEQVICLLCGDVVSEKIVEVNGTFTEEHDFDENGVCNFCGYKTAETPTAAPTETPTAAPTETPTAAPTETPTAAPTETPTTAPTATPAPTPAPPAAPVEEQDNEFVPTPEPVVEPTAAPMVDMLLNAVAEAEAEGSNVTIEIVGAQEIMTETEYTALRTLPAQEQILVMLASIGFEDVVEAATKAMNMELSSDAQTLVKQVTERMAAVSEEERAAVEEKLAQYFPVEEVEIDGVMTSYFVIDLRIEVDGVARVERYSFRQDENGGWIFEKLDLQSVEW